MAGELTSRNTAVSCCSEGRCGDEGGFFVLVPALLVKWTWMLPAASVSMMASTFGETGLQQRTSQHLQLSYPATLAQDEASHRDASACPSCELDLIESVDGVAAVLMG